MHTHTHTRAPPHTPLRLSRSPWSPQRDVQDEEGAVHYILLSAPWAVLCCYAEDLRLKLPLQGPRGAQGSPTMPTTPEAPHSVSLRVPPPISVPQEAWLGSQGGLRECAPSPGPDHPSPPGETGRGRGHLPGDLRMTRLGAAVLPTLPAPSDPRRVGVDGDVAALLSLPAGGAPGLELTSRAALGPEAQRGAGAGLASPTGSTAGRGAAGESRGLPLPEPFTCRLLGTPTHPHPAARCWPPHPHSLTSGRRVTILSRSCPTRPPIGRRACWRGWVSPTSCRRTGLMCAPSISPASSK